MPHVFERFRQADGGITRERGGPGLGLSIAKQLTEMHGGTIDAASGGVGRGATFRLKLPVMIVHPTQGESERVHPRVSTGSPTIPLGDLRGVRILAVDDDADALSLVAELLDAAGAEVTTARSAEEALRQLDTDPTSVLVADLGMPHVDGFQLIKQVRRHRNPIVRQMPAAEIRGSGESAESRIPDSPRETDRPAELVATIGALVKRSTPDVFEDASGRL